MIRGAEVRRNPSTLITSKGCVAAVANAPADAADRLCIRADSPFVRSLTPVRASKFLRVEVVISSFYGERHKETGVHASRLIPS